ncbi:probable RNA-binding protein 18 [Photinus pyralis]|uniref:probable RNA-binding protein 18 n=1 Tax=Photinus pyralis TaxID=7054 RepID=UPI0012676D09|nr:probable RNA-binding protein 18 [Photinus pyralis]
MKMSIIKDEISTNALGECSNDRRLWIGNLDPRITEYQLLKLMQKHGAIEKFDLLFHRAGPTAGQPRGYAFVTFSNKDDATLAKEQLHNKQVGTKNIIVTWAHSITTEEPEKAKTSINIPALAMAKLEKKVNRESQIEAIEAKLKLMENRNVDELEINKTVAAEPPIISLYQNKKADSSINNCNGTKHRYNLKRNDRRRAPYHKHSLRK